MSSALTLADFYFDILPDREAFLEAGGRPLPTTVWANTLKLSPARLRKLCAEEGIDLEPIPWHPAGFRLEADSQPGRRWEYLTGLMQIQEEVSMLPGVLLEALPGDRVLDLCAAPGNKTAQLAVAMENRGTLVANDRDAGRLRAFGQIAKRLGLINVSTTIYDGTKFPDLPGAFDRVLVDVPCSCEGTFRKELERRVYPSIDYARSLARTQRRLLERALRLCRPGGRVVYSTCTFSPIENEAVVSEVLREAGGGWRVVPAWLPGLEASPGLTGWRGEPFFPELVHALRIWPGRNDTGGFFVVVLEREDDPAGIPPASAGNERECSSGGRTSSCEEALPPSAGRARGSRSRVTQPHAPAVPDREACFDLEAAIAVQCERFGIPRAALDCRFVRTSQKGLYAVSVDHRPPSRLRIDWSGLLAIKTDFRYPKLSTGAAMLFGRHATRNVIELTRAQRDALLRHRDVEVSDDQVARCTGLGYVLLSYAGVWLGAGLYFPEHRVIRSLFPRYFLGPEPGKSLHPSDPAPPDASGEAELAKR